jgi:hypothetical protein
MTIVKRRRSVRVLLGLVVALGARTVVAAPMQAEAELRAVSHCSTHMGRPVSLPEARQCCEVSVEAGAPATRGAVPAPEAPVVLVTPRPVLAPQLVRPAPVLPVDARGARDGPPLYLALRTILR